MLIADGSWATLTSCSLFFYHVSVVPIFKPDFSDKKTVVIGLIHSFYSLRGRIAAVRNKCISCINKNKKIDTVNNIGITPLIFWYKIMFIQILHWIEGIWIRNWDKIVRNSYNHVYTKYTQTILFMSVSSLHILMHPSCWLSSGHKVTPPY